MSPPTFPPSGRRDRLLSSFRIDRSSSYRQGRPYQQTRLRAFDGLSTRVLPAHLKDYRNWNGHSYAESHVEEWVSKHPAALYPDQPVHVLGSQNYKRLGEKIDLLLLDGRWRFHVLELKAERVASNRGVTPDQIQRQMTRYVNFLRDELPGFPASLSGYYAQFTAEFLGSPLDLAEALCRAFGEGFCPPRDAPLVICRIFLTEGYDDSAVEYFQARQRDEDGPIRLLYYNYYPEADGHCIQFWEVPLSEDRAASGQTLMQSLPAAGDPPPLPRQADDGPLSGSVSVIRQGASDGRVRPTEPAVEPVCVGPAVYGPTGLDAAVYVLERQVLWARRNGIALQGSAGDRGRPAYTPTLDENLFEPLTEEARREYGQGQGDELQQKIRAVHSSSALACNLFHYWKSRGQPTPAAAACGLPANGVASLRFEPLLPIAAGLDRSVFPYDPNPDAVFQYAPGQKVKAAAVECKYGEPYDMRGHKGIKRAYLVLPNLWDGIPHCLDLAKRLSPDDGEFKHLHAAQLLKHLLGLKHAYGLGGFVLAYLWYDVPGGDGWRHHQEVERFADIVRRDGIDFCPVTYQDVFLRLAQQHREQHTGYVDYLAERYL